MATVASVRTALEAKLVSDLSVAAIVTRPLSRDEVIPAGVTRASVVAVVAGETHDSNVNYALGNYVITIAHRLSDGTDEDTYLDGDMLTDQASLMTRSFFRAVTGVYDITEGPNPETIERVGNVIEYTVTAQLAVAP
jgi:hypothetical protein